MHEPVISVGIVNAKSLSFVLFGDFRLNESKATYNGICTAELRQGKLVCLVNGKQVTAASEYIFSPSREQTEYFSIKDVTIGAQFHWERREKESFRGSLKIITDGKSVHAINLIAIEEYLVSVISSEMSPKCNINLLKAHAVISRSWVLSQIERTKTTGTLDSQHERGSNTEDEIIRWYDREDHSLFDVCADDHCQRYQGITRIYTDRAAQAVSQTNGLVLTYHDHICDARFSKSCGGISEAYENIWEPVPHEYLSPVVDYKFEPDEMELDLRVERNAEEWIKNSPSAFCNTSDKKILEQILPEYDQSTRDFYRWSVTYSQQQIAKLLLEKTGIDFGQVLDFVPVERGYSGRLSRLKIVGSKKTMVIGKELEIRKALSKSHLYSSAILFEKEVNADGVPTTFRIIGAGWGHGAGLCQIGAAVMAERGYNFDEILLHYYKAAKITKIY